MQAGTFQFVWPSLERILLGLGNKHLVEDLGHLLLVGDGHDHAEVLEDNSSLKTFKVLGRKLCPHENAGHD